MTDAVPDHSVVTKSFVTVMALSREDFLASCPTLMENELLQTAARARKWDKARRGSTAVAQEAPRNSRQSWACVLRPTARNLLDQARGNGAGGALADNANGRRLHPGRNRGLYARQKTRQKIGKEILRDRQPGSARPDVPPSGDVTADDDDDNAPAPGCARADVDMSAAQALPSASLEA